MAGGVGGCSKLAGRVKTPSSTSGCCLWLGGSCIRLRSDIAVLDLQQGDNGVGAERQPRRSAGVALQSPSASRETALAARSLLVAIKRRDEPCNERAQICVAA